MTRQLKASNKSSSILRHHWKPTKTCIGIIYECTVCRTWTRKVRDGQQCYGKEIK